jgi:hypothetical protein
MHLRVDRRDPVFSEQNIASVFTVEDFNLREKPRREAGSKLRELLMWNQA